MFYEGNVLTNFRGAHSITDEVNDMVSKSGVRDGFCIVSVPHTTAALIITSFWDPRGLDDLMDDIDRNIPTRVSYLHQDSPYDASGHVKSALIGNKQTLMIKNGKLVFGHSQGLVLLEFDGPRTRSFTVQAVESELWMRECSIYTEFMGMHDITEEIIKAVTESGVLRGVCHISMLHSTAGLLVTEKSASACEDIMEDIERIVPTRVDFKHRETASDAGGHVKTSITSSQVTLIVSDGAPVLGSKQAVVFAEFDGPRRRSYVIGVAKS